MSVTVHSTSSTVYTPSGVVYAASTHVDAPRYVWHIAFCQHSLSICKCCNISNIEVCCCARWGPHSFGIGLSNNPNPECMVTASQAISAKHRSRIVRDENMRVVTDELDKMVLICGKLAEESGHKWLQYYHQDAPGYFGVLYHNPYLQMAAKLASRAGYLDEDCAPFSHDLTFQLGTYLVHVLSYSEIRLKDKPLFPSQISVLKAFETDDFHDRRMEHTVDEVPEVKGVRFIGGDLQQGQRKAVKKHVPGAHLGTCDTHVFREGCVVDRACRDHGVQNANFYKQAQQPHPFRTYHGHISL